MYDYFEDIMKGLKLCVRFTELHIYFRWHFICLFSDLLRIDKTLLVKVITRSHSQTEYIL